MAWCCPDGTGTIWGWWWLVPLIGMALCIMMCMIWRPRMTGRRFCCWGGPGTDDLDRMKKDIEALKDTLGKERRPDA